MVLSRLIGIAAGAAGAHFIFRAYGWRKFDGQHLTLKLGHIGNTLAGSMVRWDSIHYLNIAAYGYKQTASTVFFPLYPLLIKLVGVPIGSNVIAGVLISLVSFGLAMVMLHRLATEELGVSAANATVLLLTFAPLSFFFAAIYTESLFLALSVGACYAARHQRWWLACACTVAATITRVPGIAVVVPVALIWWRSEPRPRWVPPALCAAPAALLAFLLYLRHLGYGLLAPLKNQELLHDHSGGGPVVTLWLALRDAGQGVDHVFEGRRVFRPSILSPIGVPLENIALLVVLVIVLLALVQCWRKLPLAYSAYASVVLVIVTWSASRPVPLIGLDRYTLTIFPLWMAAADWLQRHRLLGITVALSCGAMIYYAVEFGRWAFVG